MQKIKKENKWFYYKLVFGLLILVSLLTVYSYHMITKTWLRNVTDYPFSYSLFQWQFFSFFTYQSNFLIGLWFLIAAIYHNKPNRFIDNQNTRIAITCYITVTSITWTFFLLPSIFINSTPINVFGLVQGIFFHIFFPISMITYTLCHIESFKKSLKSYYLSSFWFYWIYPILYSVIIFIGFYLLVGNVDNIPIRIAFPYAPFFASTNNPFAVIGYLLTTIILMLYLFVLVHILFISVNLFYVFFINRKAKKKYD